MGYAAFMSLAIIVGNLHGFRTGEWKGAGRQSIRWIVAAIAMILGVCVLAKGNAMKDGISGTLARDSQAMCVSVTSS